MVNVKPPRSMVTAGNIDAGTEVLVAARFAVTTKETRCADRGAACGDGLGLSHGHRAANHQIPSRSRLPARTDVSSFSVTLEGCMFAPKANVAACQAKTGPLRASALCARGVR